MEIDNIDLSEMLGIAQLCKQAGFPKVQLDTQIAIEILNRLIKVEQRKASALGEQELHGWLKVSHISGQVRGIYLTEDVELKSERLEPVTIIRKSRMAEMREIADALYLAAGNSLIQDRREFERGDVGDIDQLEDAINAYRNFHNE